MYAHYKALKWYIYVFEDVESYDDDFNSVLLTGLPDPATVLPDYKVLT